jgi:hypothetical protein
MRRFYFHLRQGDQLLPDDEGVDLPDIAAAQREALTAAREIVTEAITSGKQTVPEAFVIADEAGLALDTVPLAAVVPESLKKVSATSIGGLFQIHFRRKFTAIEGRKG